MTHRKRARDKPSNAADLDLFRRSVSDATPLAPHDKADLEPPRPKPRRRANDHYDEAPANGLSDHVPSSVRDDLGVPLSFVRSGNRQALKQLRRKRVDDELDLHGLTVAEARPLFAAFLEHCRDTGARHVRIIHGKGLRSRNQVPVLKGIVAGWLMQRDDVLAFCEAPPAGGGAGAVVVLLKAG